MENASKALIIAGAILIAILLIGIGVALINALNAPMGQADEVMGGQAMSIFNAKFEKYNNTQNGANVQSLLSEIITSNATTQNSKTVKVWTSGIGKAGTSLVSDIAQSSASDDTATLSNVRNAIVKSGTYVVDLSYTGGYVSTVKITKK